VVHFELYALRYTFRAENSIHFPRGKAGNTLRGALLTYEQDWAPPAPLSASGYQDPPRPFVFRVRHLEGKTFAAGESFQVGLNLFDLPGLERLTRAFRQFESEGLGPVRSRVVLTGLESQRIRVALHHPRAEARRVLVHFVTPTELKGGEQPDFGLLFRRVRDRLSALIALYGRQLMRIDYRGLGERASGVETGTLNLEHVFFERTSTRTGQTHPIGGYIGTAEYTGELTEFLPYLDAAHYAGIGRHTVWGKGEISIEVLEP
jgi:hypothetical protein